MKRHVWFDRGNSNVYANTYTVLVGRPGVGKGQAIIPAVAALDASGTANLLSDRITMPYILEKLSKGFPSTVVSQASGGTLIGVDSSALIVADELQVFASTGDDVISNMTSLWDSREHAYGYGTRGKGTCDIDKPCISFLAASTPTWLVRTIPLSAVGGGFTRRVNFVFSKEAFKNKPFTSRNHSSLRDDLVNDLRHISSRIRGEYKLATEVRPLFEAYYKGCVIGELEDEATATYRDSAWVHCLKLSMAIQASLNDSMEISKEAWLGATAEVDQIVQDIQVVFRGAGMSDLTIAADRILSYLELVGYATREQIQRMMWQYVMSAELDVILKTLEQSSMITCYQQGKSTIYKIIKGAKTP